MYMWKVSYWKGNEIVSEQVRATYEREAEEELIGHRIVAVEWLY